MKLQADKNNARVVIVDDFATARETLGGLLSLDGYKLFYASSGIELLQKLDQINPDVILLDVMMPGLDGFEVCKQIRAKEQWQNLPVILVTALDSQQDLACGLEAGADDFLHKPVSGVELRARVRSMLRIKKQFDALEAILELREDLAHMIVHDMRNPLTAILGFTELLKAGAITSDDTEDIDKLHRQVLRLNSMVSDILVQAKMEDGQLLVNRTKVDVCQLAHNIIESYQLAAQSKQIKIVVDQPLAHKPVLLDVNLFQRVLDNLLSNALKFSPPTSTVTFQIEYPQVSDYTLRLKISDQGAGIPVEDRERIFNKYEIAGLRQTHDAPVGLGLAFAKLVIDAHGGHIFVESNKPKGSMFVIEI